MHGPGRVWRLRLLLARKHRLRQRRGCSCPAQPIRPCLALPCSVELLHQRPSCRCVPRNSAASGEHSVQIQLKGTSIAHVH